MNNAFPPHRKGIASVKDISVFDRIRLAVVFLIPALWDVVYYPLALGRTGAVPELRGDHALPAMLGTVVLLSLIIARYWCRLCKEARYPTSLLVLGLLLLVLAPMPFATWVALQFGHVQMHASAGLFILLAAIVNGKVLIMFVLWNAIRNPVLRSAIPWRNA